MSKDQPIDLAIIDDKDLQQFKDKKKKVERVMEVIRENGLDQDKEFMNEIDGLIEELLK
jgi:hypothetical protein